MIKVKLNRTFPEPRNPVIIVAGIRSSGGIFVETSEPSLCGVVVAVAAIVNRREPPLGLAIILERNDDVVKRRDWDWRVFGGSRKGRTVARSCESWVRWRAVSVRKLVARSAVIEAMVARDAEVCGLGF
jgi:hypothetical protein